MSAQSTSLLKAHRLALGVALDDVVEQVRALFEADGREPKGLTTSLLSCYEGRRKRPGAEYVHYLCEVYHADPADLGFEGPCVCGGAHQSEDDSCPSQGTAGGHPPAGAGTVDQPDVRPDASAFPHAGADEPPAHDEGEEADDDMLRRTMLQVLGGAVVALDGSIVGAVDRLRRRMDDAMVGATVSPMMLDEWEETTAGYGRQYMTVPPLRLLLEAMLDFSDVRRHVQRHQPVELQERLCRVAAQLGGLVGIVMVDLGDQRLAQSFFRTARIAADETGDRALRAWVVAREAVVPLYYGDPAKTVELARKSQDLAGATPCAAAAMAPALEARGHARLARLGRTESASETERALDRAESALATLPSDAQTDTAFGYTERQLRFHQGNALTHLGSTAHAADTQDEALRLYPSSVTLDRTLVRFDQAACHLHDNEVEEALRLGRHILVDMPSGHRTDIVLSRARELSGAVPASCANLPTVRDFHEELGLGLAAGAVAGREAPV